MTMILKMLGVLMIASPFIGIAIIGTLTMGVAQTLGVFLVVGIVCAVIAGGVHLAML